MSKKTIREVTFDLLRKLDITTIFGNPGSTEETFLKDFPDDFRYVQTLHESSAVGAADGYAQVTRKVAVVNVHTSSGLSNAMSGILTASMNKTPLIITAGNQTREMLLLEPWLSNLDPEVLPKPFVKWSYQPVRAEDVPAAFMRAYLAAIQPPAGPVFLSIPMDDWDKEALSETPVIRSGATKIGPDPERLEQFVQKLNSAKNPVLVYGSDIARSQGWEKAIELAEKFNVPVFSAPASERPSFPETHPLYVGGLPFAIGPLKTKLEPYDVALVIGAPVFRYYPYVAGEYIPDNFTLLHITNDPQEAARAPVGDSLLSDSLLAIEALIPKVQSKVAQPITKLESGSAPHPIAKVVATAQINPFDLFQVVKQSVPENAILVEESPSNLGELHKAWPIANPDSFYTFASGSLGWGLPASVGIALAQKDLGLNRPVISVIGDGSLQYSIQGLWTAAQHQLPILFIVPRNNEYGILKSFANLQDCSGVPGLDLPNLDIAAIARGYDCHAHHVTKLTEIPELATKAFSLNKPTVLVVDISPTVPPLF